MNLYPPESRSDRVSCGRALRGGSRSFHLASRMLPARWRHAAVALYAFCREADDAIDQSHDPAGALVDLYRRLEAIYAGHPSSHAADRAFARCIQAHSIPKQLPLALLEGFAWDAEGRQYADLFALEQYAMRVAGTVGAMMALILGVRDQDTLHRACQLGVAMQLTNIARDVGEDAAHGRLYLPLALLRRAGLEPAEFLGAPRPSAALGGCIEILLRRAESLYGSANAGIARLPRQARASMYAASCLYEAIGAQVRRQRHDAVTRRAVVSRWRQLERITTALLTALIGTPGGPAQALPAADPWVAACELPHESLPVVRTRTTGRLEWVMRLFDRLERQQQTARSPV